MFPDNRASLLAWKSVSRLWSNISALLNTVECPLWTQPVVSGTGLQLVGSVTAEPYVLPALTSKPQSPLNSLPHDRT